MKEQKVIKSSRVTFGDAFGETLKKLNEKFEKEKSQSMKEDRASSSRVYGEVYCPHCGKKI